MIRLKVNTCLFLSLLFFNTCKKVSEGNVYVGTWYGNGNGCIDVIEIKANSYATYSVQGNSSDCHGGPRFEGDFKVGPWHFYIEKKKFTIVSKPKSIEEFVCDLSGYGGNHVTFATNTVMEIKKPRFYEHGYTVKMYKKK